MNEKKYIKWLRKNGFDYVNYSGYFIVSDRYGTILNGTDYGVVRFYEHMMLIDNPKWLDLIKATFEYVEAINNKGETK